MKPQAIILVLIIAMVFGSCRNNADMDKDLVKNKHTDSIENIEELNEHETLDTTIFLSGINTSNYAGDKLTLEIAEEVLYQHYVKKEYFRPDKIPDIIKKEDEEKLVVYFDTIHFVNLNNNEFRDAIISYWLTPPGASGHCWQPHKAIVSDTDKGYKISHEEFIPTNFAIDSVINENNKYVINGYDYDCIEHEILKKLRITLKTEKK